MYKIKELRDQIGINQAAFARRIGITQAGLSKIETGISVPSSDVLLRIAKEFRVSLDWLCDLHIETNNVTDFFERIFSFIESSFVIFSVDTDEKGYICRLDLHGDNTSAEREAMKYCLDEYIKVQKQLVKMDDPEVKQNFYSIWKERMLSDLQGRLAANSKEERQRIVALMNRDPKPF